MINKEYGVSRRQKLIKSRAARAQNRDGDKRLETEPIKEKILNIKQIANSINIVIIRIY